MTEREHGEAASGSSGEDQPVPLGVRDLADLERQLVGTAGNIPESPDSLLRDVGKWFYEQAQPLAILDAQAFTSFCECIRSAAEDYARRLALGALITMQRDAERLPDRARFVARFALRRIVALTGRAVEWDGIPIPQASATEAGELFEVACGDSKYADEELIVSARRFIDRFGASTDMFGRFAQDLGILLDVLEDPAVSTAHRNVARGGLIYFVEVSDAIPDDLGLVGLLDDALVVRRAVEKLRPGRSALSSYLDLVIRDWPFLVDLAIEAESDRHALSEFMIINVALLLREVEGKAADQRGVVLVVHESGPLPFLIGFVRALAQVGRYVSPGPPEFEAGERLADRETGAEVEFQDYGRLVGTDFQKCGVDLATHFRVAHPGRKGGGRVLRIKPIADLASLTRSPRKAGYWRGGPVPMDASQTTLGPLERTFTSTTPITIPGRAGHVVVVGPLGASEFLAGSLRLHGTPLLDVLPMGQARIGEDEVVRRKWTKQGPGGVPLLTMVQTPAEAAELAEDAETPVLGIVAGVRPNSADAGTLRRMADDGIPVLAVVEERDVESQQSFEGGTFNFWSWDEEWLGYLHWPPTPAKRTSHPVADYEDGFRRRSSARVTVVPLDSPELDAAHQGLLRLEQLERARSDETLQAALGDGYLVLLTLCRRCVGRLDDALGSIAKLRVALRSGRQWWPDDVIGAAEEVAAALDDASKALGQGNPKHDFLLSWAAEHADGTVVARQDDRERAARVPELAGLKWPVRPARTTVYGPMLIPGWLARPSMERLLVPPASSSVTLALYGPERAWYRSMMVGRERTTARLRKLVRERSSIPLTTAYRMVEPPPAPEPEGPIVDEVVNRVRRAQVLRHLGAGSAEDVEARLVYFVGGHWTAFSPTARVNTVTHLVEARNAKEGEKLRELLASELRAGDRVIMVRGSDRDALQEAADRELPPGARESAGLWRAAIHSFLRAGHFQSEVRERLAKKGCRRAPETIRSWVSDDRIIGPKDALDGTIEAIQEATGDWRLKEKLHECKEAIHLVRSTHFTVANRLAARVLERARGWLEADTSPDQIVELEDRLVLLTVESTDPELAKVPRHAINRLREEA